MDVQPEKPTKLRGLARQVAAKRSFIAAFRDTVSVTASCKAAKVLRETVMRWRKDDAFFRGLWEEIQEEAAQTLEDEAIRRAHAGVKRPLFYRGKPMYTGRGKNRRPIHEVEYSDQLLITLLKRYRPHLYREHTETVLTGTIEIVERLQAGRQRLLEMKQDDRAAG